MIISNLKRIKTKYIKFRVSLVVALITIFCFNSFYSFGACQSETFEQQNLKSAENTEMIAHARALWILRILLDNSDSKQITPLQKDSILKFLESSKLSDTMFVALASALSAAAVNKTIESNSGSLQFLGGDNRSSNSIHFNNRKLNPIMQQANEFSTYKNSSTFLPDKLPIPDRDRNNRTPYMSNEQLKNKMLKYDYFSKGIDGYYRKLVEMAYVDQGWIETKEAREAVDRARTSIMMNLRSGAYDGLSDIKEPHFINQMCSSNNPLFIVFGTLLRILNNNISNQLEYNSPGYKSTTNYLMPIKTPPPPNKSGPLKNQ